MNQPRNFFNTLNHVPILRVLTAPFIAPLPEIPVRQANVVKPRQPRRHLAAALGLILSIICVLPVAAQTSAGITVTETDGSTATTEAGGTDTINVVLDTQPGSNVTIAVSSSDTTEGTVDKRSLVFTDSNWDTPQTVTVTGQDDSLVDGDQPYDIVLAAAVSSDGNYNGVDPADVSVTNTDNDTAGVILSTSAVTVTEATGTGRTATYTVVLGTEPTANVTIAITGGDTSIATVSPASLTFTTANWSTPQIVTVTGQDEDIDNGVSKSVSIYHTPSGRGYGDRDTVLLFVNVLDDDIAGITVTETSGSTATTEAGGADTISVVLDTEPTADVTIAVSSSDTTEGMVDKSSLVFIASNWSTPQIVTVTGQDDNLADGDQNYTIVLAKAVSGDVHYGGSLTRYNAINPADVTVTNTDDDAGVMLSTSAVTVTEASGSSNTATYTVKLSIQPSGNVTVTPTSSDTSVATVSPASLIFTTSNWNTAQPITVTGVDDSTDGDRSTTITHTVTGADYASVSAASVVVTLTDDDNSPPTGAVTITGTVTQGQTLTAVTSTIVDPDGPSNLIFTYQWERDGTDISGATGNTYVLKQADVGKAITVTVSWTDGGGTAESLTSVATSAVTPPPAAPAGLKVIVRSGKIKFRWEIPNNPDITGYQYKQWTGNTEPSPGTWVDFSGAMSATTQNRSVRGLTDGTEYNFRIRAIAGSVTGTPSGVITVTPSITPDVPARPAAVTAVAGNGQVTLSWNNPNNAAITRYQIRRQVAPEDWGNWADISGSGKDTTSYTVTGLTNNIWHRFRIRAIASTAVYGLASSDVSARPMASPSPPPSKPTGLAAVVGNGQVTLSWDNPNNAAITRYQIRRQVASEYWGNWADISGSGKDTTSYTVTGLTNNIWHRFRIRAIAGSVTGTPSDVMTVTPSITPDVPARPAAVTAVAGDGQVTLSWDNPNNALITRYQIRRQDVTIAHDGGKTSGNWSDWSDIPGSGKDTTGYTVTGLTNGMKYNFRIRAVAGTSSYGKASSAAGARLAIPAAPAPPAPKPTGLSKVIDSGQVTLTWDHPNNPAITRYQYKYWTGSPESGRWIDISGSDKDTTSHVVTGLTNGTKYHFRIRAMIGRIAGVKSSSTSATPATPPTQAAPIKVSAHARYRQVELIWRDPTLTDQRDTTISKYQIKYWSGNSETGDWSDISATINSTNAYYLVTGLTNNTTYSFRIRGLTNGFITTESNLVQATPLAGPPRTPSRPQAVAGDSEVTLTWDHPNNRDITKYQIKQWTGGGERGSWGDWNDIPGSDKDTTDYTVPALTNGVKYSFRIRAVAGSVTGSQSPYTAVVIPAAPVVVPGGITVAVRDSVGDSIAISVGIIHTGTRTVDSVVPTTEDGGSYSFTVVLDTQPSANVSIAVSSSDTTEGTVDKNSLVFTTTNWNTPQTVTVTGQADTLTDGDQDYTIILAAAVSTDTNYHGIDPIDIAITNTDTDTATRGTRSVTMGGFTVIGADPGSLGVDGDKINARVTGVGIQLALPSEHRVTRAAFSRPTPEQLPPPQAGVTFGAAPAYVNVELAPPLPASSPATVCLQRPAGMLSHAAVYHLAEQGREWEALAGADHQERRPGYICGSMRSGSPVVVGTRTLGGATHSRDDDTRGVTLSATRVTVTEASGAGRTATYTVVLTAQPTGAVTITPSSGEPGVATVSTAASSNTLTFTSANWDTAQPVTVTGVDDRVDADRSTTITHTVTGGGYDAVRISDVAVTLTDDDTVEVTMFGFAGDTLKVTEADGAMHRNYYQIVLKSQPSGDVTVTPTSGDTGIATITPSSLTFTADNWAKPQSIAVTGVDDHVDAGDRRTAITHTISGGGYDSVRIPDVVVTLIDDDVAGVTVSETDGSTATTESGGSDSISVVLDSQPTAEVTLTVTSSDTTEGTVDKSSLVFTPNNWATAQVVTVTGVDDRLDDGEQSYKIELGVVASRDRNYDGINPDDVVVTSKVSVKITGVVGKTKIEGNTITAEVIGGAGVQLTLPAGHGVAQVAFAVPRSVPAAQAGVTFGDEPAYVGIRIDAQLPSSSSASVCLKEPAGLSGTLFVYHLADGANKWEKLLPASAPSGYVCGKTKDFSVFVVGSPTPVFGSAFVDDYVWTVGEAVDVELPAATGGDGTITYRLRPALPAGLTFNAKARTITGTPNEVFATTEFTYTARDTDGHTGQLQFRVTVQAAEVKERSRALAVALASFGRTAAAEAVDVISRRFIAAPVARSGITLGGTALSSVGSRSASAVLSLAEVRGAGGATVDGLNPGLITWRGVSARELFSQSDFVLPLQGPEEDRVRTGWTFWGQGSAGRFSGEANAIETDGELHTGYMGLDYRFGSNHNALAGVAFSHSAGEVDYAVAGDFLLVNGERGGITGEVDLAMTSVLPYVHYTPRLGLGIWGLAGAGSGEVKLKDQGGSVETDVRMVMAAVGVRQRLKTWRGVDFAVKSDVLAVELKTDAAAGLEAVTGDARRARLALEMGVERVLSPDSLLRPDIEFSGRWDDGDADNGIGVEISGGVAYVQSRLGLRLGVRGRYLLAHEESEFADWGGSFALQIGEGLGGHGLWLSYEPQWGAPASGVEQLWDGEGIGEVGGAGRMKFDLGYGMTTRGRGWLVTPYGGVLTTGQDTRYRLGAQAEVDKSMDISLEGVRRENAEGATEHSIFLRWKFLL